MNNEKSNQLGISFSTACGRLRKEVMFHLVQKCEMDICCRCGTKILCSQDLTIDHIMPWLHSENPAESFFDINNIAFSHSKCNYGLNRGSFKPKSSTGYKGVYYQKDRKHNKRFKAMISIKDKMKVIGYAVTNKSLGLI